MKITEKMYAVIDPERWRGKGEGSYIEFNDGVSKGTANMVQQAVNAGIPVWTSQMGIEKLPVFIANLKARRNAR